MCQKPFINSNFLKTFSAQVEGRVGHLCDSWDMASNTEAGGKGIVQDVDLHSQHLFLDIIAPIAFDHNFKLLEKSRELITGSAAGPSHHPLTAPLYPYTHVPHPPSCPSARFVFGWHFSTFE